MPLDCFVSNGSNTRPTCRTCLFHTLTPNSSSARCEGQYDRHYPRGRYVRHGDGKWYHIGRRFTPVEPAPHDFVSIRDLSADEIESVEKVVGPHTHHATMRVPLDAPFHQGEH